MSAHYKRRRATENSDNGDEPPKGYAQVLPIGDLPEGFDGEVLDGATYLAMASRERAKLPFFTRAKLPTPPPTESATPAPTAAPGPSATTATAASSSRHPALPRESWGIAFAQHFKAYRASFAAKSWPPKAKLPYPETYPPTPQLSDGAAWLAFIDGAPVQLPRGRGDRGRKGKGKEEVGDGEAGDAAVEEAELEGATVVDANAAAVDEEEAADGVVVAAHRGAPPVDSAAAASDMEVDTDMENDEVEVEDDENFDYDDDDAYNYDDDNDGNDYDETMDEEEWVRAGAPPVYTPREPLLGVLQSLSMLQTLPLLKHLSHSARATQSLPAHRARWAFALLATLPPQLGARETAVLRDLARAAGTAAVTAWCAAHDAGRHKTAAAPVYPGFYGSKPVLGEVPVGEAVSLSASAAGDEEGATWTLGARWKRVRDVRPRSDATPRPESAEAAYERGGVDEALASAWMVVHAVAGGWAQWDLVEDLERAFGRLPRP